MIGGLSVHVKIYGSWGIREDAESDLIETWMLANVLWLFSPFNDTLRQGNLIHFQDMQLCLFHFRHLPQCDQLYRRGFIPEGLKSRPRFAQKGSRVTDFALPLPSPSSPFLKWWKIITLLYIVLNLDFGSFCLSDMML